MPWSRTLQLLFMALYLEKKMARGSYGGEYHDRKSWHYDQLRHCPYLHWDYLIRLSKQSCFCWVYVKTVTHLILWDQFHPLPPRVLYTKRDNLQTEITFHYFDVLKQHMASCCWNLSEVGGLSYISMNYFGIILNKRTEYRPDTNRGRLNGE